MKMYHGRILVAFYFAALTAPMSAELSDFSVLTPKIEIFRQKFEFDLFAQMFRISDSWIVKFKTTYM